MKKIMRGLIAVAFISTIGLTGFARSAFAAPSNSLNAQTHTVSAASHKTRDRDNLQDTVSSDPGRRDRDNIQDSTSPDRGGQPAKRNRDDRGRGDRGRNDRGRSREDHDDRGRDRGGMGRSGHNDGGRSDRGNSRR
ncbi:hypothetical protein [Thermocoleostomius sinensis]|uniref:Uncharacterized protein n=1 Tax=Thermocoleostomius sinensis A174 TaxID=2016057 RepID=A0A9E8ZEL8_9CYAN|nr:hypothetical protein [Thermocoleostomius sinensis]WAL59948.1 hypothetical protein OXH18_22700 [Thermocoleostomius sinensis A174]